MCSLKADGQVWHLLPYGFCLHVTLPLRHILALMHLQMASSESPDRQLQPDLGGSHTHPPNHSSQCLAWTRVLRQAPYGAPHAHRVRIHPAARREYQTVHLRLRALCVSYNVRRKPRYASAGELHECGPVCGKVVEC